MCSRMIWMTVLVSVFCVGAALPSHGARHVVLSYDVSVSMVRLKGEPEERWFYNEDIGRLNDYIGVLLFGAEPMSCSNASDQLIISKSFPWPLLTSGARLSFFTFTKHFSMEYKYAEIHREDLASKLPAAVNAFTGMNSAVERARIWIYDLYDQYPEDDTFWIMVSDKDQALSSTHRLSTKELRRLAAIREKYSEDLLVQLFVRNRVYVEVYQIGPKTTTTTVVDTIEVEKIPGLMLTQGDETLLGEKLLKPLVLKRGKDGVLQGKITLHGESMSDDPNFRLLNLAIGHKIERISTDCSLPYTALVSLPKGSPSLGHFLLLVTYRYKDFDPHQKRLEIPYQVRIGVPKWLIGIVLIIAVFVVGKKLLKPLFSGKPPNGVETGIQTDIQTEGENTKKRGARFRGLSDLSGIFRRRPPIRITLEREGKQEEARLMDKEVLGLTAEARGCSGTVDWDSEDYVLAYHRGKVSLCYAEGGGRIREVKDGEEVEEIDAYISIERIPAYQPEEEERIEDAENKGARAY